MTKENFKTLAEMSVQDWFLAGKERWDFEDSDGKPTKLAGFSEDGVLFFEGLYTRGFNFLGECVVPKGDDFRIVKRIK